MESDKRFLSELMQYATGASGAALKDKYGPKPVETPEQRLARKRQEYMEETGGDEAAWDALQASKAQPPPAPAAEPSVLEQIKKLMGL